MKFHKQEWVVTVVALSGILALLNQMGSYAEKLYRLALTPQGLAALVVGLAMLNVAFVVVITVVLVQSRKQ